MKLILSLGSLLLIFNSVTAQDSPSPIQGSGHNTTPQTDTVTRGAISILTTSNNTQFIFVPLIEFDGYIWSIEMSRAAHVIDPEDLDDLPSAELIPISSTPPDESPIYIDDSLK